MEDFWSTEMVLRHVGGGRWQAWAKANNPAATEAVIETCFLDSPGEAVDRLLADAERLGIRWGNGLPGGPHLFYQGDGESKDWPPPEGWREVCRAEAKRIGWGCIYQD